MPDSLQPQFRSQQISPFLFEHAIPRTGTDEIPGQYCPVRHVWVVDDQPIVQANAALAELVTKTATAPERDDTQEPLLELQTKTNLQVERDDENFEMRCLELMTKTLSQVERDDENPNFINN